MTWCDYDVFDAADQYVGTIRAISGRDAIYRARRKWPALVTVTVRKAAYERRDA